FPRGIDVARPEEGGVALHAGVAVAMERVWAAVGPVDLAAIPVHPDSREPRRAIERVAFVRPPAIDTHRENASMGVPVASRLGFVDTFGIESIARSATDRAGADDDMRHDVEVHLVEIVEHRPWVWKGGGVERERAMSGVPAGRAKSSAQVDQHVARQLLLAKRSRNRKHKLPAGKRPV